MKFKRFYTQQLYRLEAMSPTKLISVLVGTALVPTILLFLFFSPQKFHKLIFESRQQPKYIQLSPIAQGYKDVGINPFLDTMGDNFNPYLVIFNRVPKCASIYTTRMLYHLGNKGNNNFKVMSPYVQGEHPWLSDSEIEEKVGWMTSVRNNNYPLVYIRHEYFIEFEKWGGENQPIYINIIRDPIERFTSFYYFVRNGNQEGDGAEVKMPEMKKRLTLDECVQLRDRECMQPEWQLIPYFCGQEPMCRHRASWAVQKAKQNIDRYFAVVGIAEDMDTTFSVMEKMLPRYFKGARELNSIPSKFLRNDTRTLGKVPPSDATRRILKARTSLALEYELYNFVRDRLYAMDRQLNR